MCLGQKGMIKGISLKFFLLESQRMQLQPFFSLQYWLWLVRRNIYWARLHPISSKQVPMEIGTVNKWWEHEVHHDVMAGRAKDQGKSGTPITSHLGQDMEKHVDELQPTTYGEFHSR